jgi:hypothetical protein
MEISSSCERKRRLSLETGEGARVQVQANLGDNVLLQGFARQHKVVIRPEPVARNLAAGYATVCATVAAGSAAAPAASRPAALLTAEAATGTAAANATCRARTATGSRAAYAANLDGRSSAAAGRQPGNHVFGIEGKDVGLFLACQVVDFSDGPFGIPHEIVEELCVFARIANQFFDSVGAVRVVGRASGVHFLVRHRRSSSDSTRELNVLNTFLGI